ncbi:hypothetical protein BDN70DRAFT_937323 [Pholiota conissans]|uniref:Uncharacterized protein n=1 Tax=Pholiota conissans TaxID=109636 RepID=A0A9P5YTP3_9AGAR|nr:hypothetical protein BDN70DRAFT_937323 [Pholiota conissans]
MLVTLQLFLSHFKKSTLTTSSHPPYFCKMLTRYHFPIFRNSFYRTVNGERSVPVIFTNKFMDVNRKTVRLSTYIFEDKSGTYYVEEKNFVVFVLALCAGCLSSNEHLYSLEVPEVDTDIGRASPNYSTLYDSNDADQDDSEDMNRVTIGAVTLRFSPALRLSQLTENQSVETFASYEIRTANRVMSAPFSIPRSTPAAPVVQPISVTYSPMSSMFSFRTATSKFRRNSVNNAGKTVLNHLRNLFSPFLMLKNINWKLGSVVHWKTDYTSTSVDDQKSSATLSHDVDLTASAPESQERTNSPVLDHALIPFANDDEELDILPTSEDVGNKRRNNSPIRAIVRGMTQRTLGVRTF